jgi:starvation-inducible DNA-binding protein
METLIELMKKVLADSYAFTIKAQNYHWNVEGPNFPQYHEFFGKLYEEVYSSIDTTAEEIRALGSYAPGSFSRFQELSDIEDETGFPVPAEMFRKLLADNQIIIETLTTAFGLADNFNEQGLADYIAGRIDAHKKHDWMLKSISK